MDDDWGYPYSSKPPYRECTALCLVGQMLVKQAARCSPKGCFPILSVSHYQKSIYITPAFISTFPSLHKAITYRTGENEEDPQDHRSESDALPRPLTSGPPQSEPG